MLRLKLNNIFHQSQLTEAWIKNNEFVVIDEFSPFLPIQLSKQNTYATDTQTHTVSWFFSCCKNRSQFAFDLHLQIKCRTLPLLLSLLLIYPLFMCVFSIRISLNLLRVWDALHKDLWQNSSTPTDCLFPNSLASWWNGERCSEPLIQSLNGSKYTHKRRYTQCMES